MTDRRRLRLACGALVACALAAAGCQHDVRTDFPPGLEPLEANPIPAQDSGPYAEALRVQTDDTGYIHVYGLGYVLAEPATVWQATKTPTAVIAVCKTTHQTITPGDDPQYELSFSVHYEVDDIVTVEWDDAWRFGTVEGTPAAPELAMVKHQKTGGSSFVRTSEGTVELAPAAGDPTVTQLAFVEHLDAVSGSDADVILSMKHEFAAIVALSHGEPVPPCP